MDKPLVSIIIAAYNAEPYIENCLDSVLCQTYGNLEIIIVDDASTDKTRAIVESYGKKDSRIVLESMGCNSGSPAARNRGYEIANGDYLTSVDADDTIAPDTIEKCVEELDKDPELDFVTFKMMMVYPESGEIKPYPINSSVPEVMTGEEACHWSINYDFAPNGMSRASLDKNFPSETKYGQYGDETTTHLILLKAGKVKLGQGEYFYYQWPASRTHKFSILKFEVLECRLSLKRQLIETGRIGKETLDRLERRRWREFIDVCYMFFKYKNELTTAERKSVFARMGETYKTIERKRLPLKSVIKPGYMLLPTFKLFYLQLCVLFRIRSLYALIKKVTRV